MLRAPLRASIDRGVQEVLHRPRWMSPEWQQKVKRETRQRMARFAVEAAWDVATEIAVSTDITPQGMTRLTRTILRDMLRYNGSNFSKLYGVPCASTAPHFGD